MRTQYNHLECYRTASYALTAMPRDDLHINFARKDMPITDIAQDAGSVLEDFINRAANLPSEIVFMNEEIQAKDRIIQSCIEAIQQRDNAIQKFIKLSSSAVENPKEEAMRKIISENYDKVQVLQEEKIVLATRCQMALDKHLRYLDIHIKSLQERGDFPSDLDLPSLLTRKTEEKSETPDSATTPLTQHPGVLNQQGGTARSLQQDGIKRPTQMFASLPPGVQTQTASTSPAAALLMQRQQRESSIGAANKRQRLTGNVTNVPSNSSGLAKHEPVGPGTPKANTPGSVRAGSAGPGRGQKAVTGKKKLAPHKQAIGVKKGKPGKSGLHRVKRTGVKNSSSSTGDSELSEVEDVSGDDDEDVLTPPPIRRPSKAENGGEEGDGDDRTYCICHTVSFGDMVACDNDDCPDEWFHWSCVGLKAEPEGKWYCPPCTKVMLEGRKKGKKGFDLMV
jgi:inhibitor of growth protein 3